MNVVITGSSRGIGRALTERLMGRGHRVWGIARSDQADFAAQHQGQFHFSRCDVSNWPAVEQAAREVAGAWSHVDGLVACAGLQGEIGRALSVDPVRWAKTVRTNLEGTFYTVRGFDELLTRTNARAKVVCFSGGGATKARARFSAYGVAKTGIVRLVETIAEEERGRAYDINAIAPGAINTRMTDEVIALGPNIVGEAEFAAAKKQKECGGASLDDALGLVEWLLSRASDGISGRLLAAPWDPWPTLAAHARDLAETDIYTLRRIVPGERGQQWK